MADHAAFELARQVEARHHSSSSASAAWSIIARISSSDDGDASIQAISHSTKSPLAYATPVKTSASPSSGMGTPSSSHSTAAPMFVVWTAIVGSAIGAPAAIILN